MESYCNISACANFLDNELSEIEDDPLVSDNSSMDCNHPTHVREDVKNIQRGGVYIYTFLDAIASLEIRYIQVTHLLSYSLTELKSPCRS